MKRSGSSASLLFRLVVPACVVFILTILVMIASVFGNPRAPLTQWLERYIGTLLTVEFFATMAIVLLAMTMDRIRTLKSGHAVSRTEQNETQTDAGNHSGSET